MKQLLVLILIVFSGTPLHAQYLGYQNNQTEPSKYNVESIEGITASMLKLISGNKNEKRNWVAFRDLFLPTAQFIFLDPKSKTGEYSRSYNLEEFIRLVGPIYAKNGFIENPLGIRIQEFNGIANVFQSFEAKNLTGTYQARGVNSYQLVYHSGRWWISSTTWSNETVNAKIPREYIGDASTDQTGDSPINSNSGQNKKDRIILKKR